MISNSLLPLYTYSYNICLCGPGGCGVGPGRSAARPLRFSATPVRHATRSPSATSRPTSPRPARPARATATPRPRPAPSVDRTSARASPAPPALIDPLVRLRAPAAFACHARPRTPARHQSPRIDLTHTQHTQLSLTARCPHCHMHMDGMRCAHSSHTDTPRHARLTRLSLSLSTHAHAFPAHTHTCGGGGDAQYTYTYRTHNTVLHHLSSPPSPPPPPPPPASPPHPPSPPC